MPIHCSLEIGSISDAAFAELDRMVMGSAFASQNLLGRLCDERVYENDLAAGYGRKGSQSFTRNCQSKLRTRDSAKPTGSIWC